MLDIKFEIDLEYEGRITLWKNIDEVSDEVSVPQAIVWLETLDTFIKLKKKELEDVSIN